MFYFSAQLKRTVYLNFQCKVDKELKKELKKNKSVSQSNVDGAENPKTSLNASDSEEEADGKVDPYFGTISKSIQLEELNLKVKAHVLTQELDRDEQRIHDNVIDYLRRLYPSGYEDEDDVDERPELTMSYQANKDLKKLFKQEFDEVLDHISYKAKTYTDSENDNEIAQ